MRPPPGSSTSRRSHRAAALALLCVALGLCPRAPRPGSDGRFRELLPADLRVGSSTDLSGQWLYQPGYAVAPGGAPESAVPAGAVRVPVPQMLNRIRFWLDDSEDFDRRETARLAALGFDTERAEDGWYYLGIDVPALPRGRHVFLEFEGVAMRSRTYLNGRRLGEHEGMFSRFDYDLTPHLRAGANLIAVFVSMEKIPPEALAMGEAVTVNLTASKVKTMSKGMFGPLSPHRDNRAYDLHGIWQPVKLVARGAARLDDVWFVPSQHGAEVRVTARALVDVRDFGSASGPASRALSGGGAARVKARWTDLRTGKLFAEVGPEAIALSPEGASCTLVLRDADPVRWTPADPYLYRLDVTLESEAGELLDAWTRDVGFRTFEIRGNRFFLNGKPYWLRGANHLPYGKNPFDPALARRLVKALHDANVRITRTHGTPWNEAWLDAADEIGLAVSLEGIRPWALAGKIGETPPGLFAHWLMENEDVVKRARNHPSVFMYTAGNEMLLRDTANLAKWRQLSDVVKQTRRLDPTLPVIASSEYARDPELYAGALRPNGVDDGDADDLHRYNNWYGPSSFVTSAALEAEVKQNGGARPLIGQEMSTGYPDLDTGLPVARYTRDLLTPEAWVGPHALPGSDPAIFLEHHRAVTKRWAERLRFERGDHTAGFQLFAAECWFSHSYDAALAKPYPVVDAVRDALAPVGIALSTSRRRFFAGEQVDTEVLVTNDDERGRGFAGLRLAIDLLEGGEIVRTGELARVPDLAYYATVRAPVRITLPEVNARRRLELRLRLLAGGEEIGRTTDLVEVHPATPPVEIATTAFVRDLGPDLQRFLRTTARFAALAPPAGAGVLLLGGGSVHGLERGGALRAAIERGATAIVLSPREELTALFPADVSEGRVAPGEYADFSPCAGTRLAEGLAPMDLKWWGRKDDWRVFVADTSHRLPAGSRGRELVRFVPPHGYIPESRKAEQYRAVVLEIPLGRGRLWICDLDLEASVSVDPAAQRFAVNLLRAAADPGSTTRLPKVPSR